MVKQKPAVIIIQHIYTTLFVNLFPDEVVKQVRIRVTLSGELISEKQFFTVNVKAPSGAMLDDNSEAHVVMHGGYSFFLIDLMNNSF